MDAKWRTHGDHRGLKRPQRPLASVSILRRLSPAVRAFRATFVTSARFCDVHSLSLACESILTREASMRIHHSDVLQLTCVATILMRFNRLMRRDIMIFATTRCIEQPDIQ